METIQRIHSFLGPLGVPYLVVTLASVFLALAFASFRDSSGRRTLFWLFALMPLVVGVVTASLLYAVFGHPLIMTEGRGVIPSVLAHVGWPLPVGMLVSLALALFVRGNSSKPEAGA